MNALQLQTHLMGKNTNEKYSFILERIIKLDQLWFLDNEGELIFYTDENGNYFVPIWSDETSAIINPPPNTNIKPAKMNIETFLLQFVIFLFNGQIRVVISPFQNEQNMMTQNALEFARDLIEKIREIKGEKYAMYYLSELKKLIS